MWGRVFKGNVGFSTRALRLPSFGFDIDEDTDTDTDTDMCQHDALAGNRSIRYFFLPRSLSKVALYSSTSCPRREKTTK